MNNTCSSQQIYLYYSPTPNKSSIERELFPDYNTPSSDREKYFNEQLLCFEEL